MPRAVTWRPIGHRPYRRRRPGRSRSPDPASAAQLLQEADAILHDDLVPPAILARARRDAELLCRRQAQRPRELGAGRHQRRAGAPRARRPDRGAAEGGRSVRVRPRRRGGRGLARSRPAGRGRAGHHRGAGLRGLGRHSADASSHRFGRDLRQRPQRRQGSREPHGRRWRRRAIRSPSTWAPRKPLPCATVYWAPALIPTRRSPSSRTARDPTNGFRLGRLADLARLAAPHVSRGDAGPSLIIVGEVAALAAKAEQPLLAKVS